MNRALILALFLAIPLPVLALSLPWSTETAPPNAPPPAPPRPVASLIVSDRMTNTHSIPGVIRARIEVALAFQTLGRLTARSVDVGDVVKQGQLLATLDPDDLQGQVRAAQAAAEAAKVDLQTALAAAERTRALAQRNVSSTAQLEQAEQALAAAQAADQQAQSELIRARDAEGYTEMRAPFDGVISAVQSTQGAVVSAGEPVMQLSAQNKLEAVIDLPAAIAARISAGDLFEIWTENHPQTTQQARVARVEPVADAATRTRRVRMDLDNGDPFRLGALIRARPATGNLRQLTVPASAIVERDGPHVWVVTRDDDGATVSLRRIGTRGIEIGGMVVVTEGLAAGAEVVIRGVHSLAEGQTVGESVAP